jgi:hypothetical protein
MMMPRLLEKTSNTAQEASYLCSGELFVLKKPHSMGRWECPSQSIRSIDIDFASAVDSDVVQYAGELNITMNEVPDSRRHDSTLVLHVSRVKIQRFHDQFRSTPTDLHQGSKMHRCHCC